jgi:RimJ/RimL family protein N-acetyltransferase
MTAALNDPEIVRWTRVPSPYTRTDAEDFLRLMEEARLAGTELALAIVGAGDDELLGSISMRPVSREHRRGELGYLDFAHARGRGVATRAVRLLARYGYDQLDLERIEILAHPENLASQRVAEKAGFTREGLLRGYHRLRGEREDRVMFSQLREELQIGDPSRPRRAPGRARRSSHR